MTMKNAKLSFRAHSVDGLERYFVLLLLFLAALPLTAQTCASGSDMDAATHSALESEGQQVFGMIARGDIAGMKQNAIPSLAANFGSIETAVNDNKSMYTGAQATPRGLYLLNAPGTATISRAEFLCGVWGTPNFTGFAIPNLPPGQYAIVIEDLSGGKTPGTMSLVLQNEAGAWKLAGLYTKSNLAAGHDGNWYLEQARQYKERGQVHDAWFYYLIARDLLAPVPFMSTRALDSLYDESQSVKPSDMPPAAPLTLMANGKTYNVTQIFALPVGEGLDLVAKYSSPDISNQVQTYADNTAVIKALVARFPELRQAFAGVVVRAVGPNGADYGTLLAMKDVK